MKILNKNTNNKIQFNFMNKNIFLINNIEIMEDICNSYALMFANKSSSIDYEIEVEQNDILIDKTVTKLIKIPNYFDFQKDICGGSKAILKELISFCLTYDAFSSESITNLFGIINTIDLTELKALELLQNNLEQKLNIKFKYELQDQIINYIAEQTILVIDDEVENKSFLFSQNKLRIIYLEILKILIKVSDKNLHFLFLNPFLGLNYEEMYHHYKNLDSIDNYTIITEKFVSEEKIDYSLMKLYLGDSIIDLSEIYDNKTFFSNFSDLTDDEAFINELKLKVDNLIVNYNTKNLDLSYPVFQYLLNK
ncbi:hypothetical protein SHELI_v1c09470 [Spiroplasma helicoides]|uniref:Uncharacterized protein n=1 Tax=Spiroplasma helicoides TaxID=216938 RepID=A0A1B3SLS7_9MOLU|nr:hypothetical protein [Spiroplasma helicoides]AOG60896.1 hypothetical protein SHELI_v1c09470 [Spiroplasma helicoides]